MEAHFSAKMNNWFNNEEHEDVPANKVKPNAAEFNASQKKLTIKVMQWNTVEGQLRNQDTFSLAEAKPKRIKMDRQRKQKLKKRAKAGYNKEIFVCFMKQTCKIREYC